MIMALLSFLGGNAFRMIWGELSAWLTARQEHTHELERMRLQGEMDAAQHARNLEAQRLQADLGVQVIRVQAEADAGKIESSAWADVVRSTTVQTGIFVVDLWNGIIRPYGATLCFFLLTMESYRSGWAINEETRVIIGMFLGIYTADRSLAKRGK